MPSIEHHLVNVFLDILTSYNIICESHLFQLRKKKIELITILPSSQFHPLKELADPFPEQGYGEKEEKIIILLKSNISKWNYGRLDS
jgi:hypothetical protein